MAADDAKGDSEFASDVPLVRVAGTSSNLTPDADLHFEDFEDEPLPPLPPVPPMPVRSGVTAAIAQAAASMIQKVVARDKSSVVGPAGSESSFPDGSGSRAPDAKSQRDASKNVPEQAARIKGWVTLDPDLVFRGWAMSVGACDRKVEVALYIDDVLVTRARAENFRQDLPCEDKRHGFKFAVPKRFLDSAEHRWVVRAGEDGSKLSSGTSTFTAAPDAAPVIAVNRIAPDVISGVIEAPALVKCGNPNVWTGDDALAIAEDARVWIASGRKGSYPFDIPISPDQFHLILSRGLRLGIPGDRTGERAIDIAPPVSWDVQKDRLLISVGAPFEFYSDVSSPLTVSVRGSDVSTLERLRFTSDGSAEYRIGARLLESGFVARLGNVDAKLTAPSARYQVSGGRTGVVANWDFGIWRNGVPVGWQPAAGLLVERRFASSAHTELPGCSGDTILLWTGDAPPGGDALLRQSLTGGSLKSAVVGLVARAAQRCQVELVLSGEDDVALARLPVSLTRDWQRLVLDLPLDNVSIMTLELRMLAPGAPWVELAGFDLAAGAGSLFSETSDSAPTEIIVNPTLQGWAPESYPLACTARTELARGWWVSASKGTDVVAYPVPLSLLSRGATPGHFALAASTNAMTKFVRIETRIDQYGFESGRTYALTFHASATSPIDDGSLPRYQKWPIIDRIFVMARDPQSGAGRFLFDCARRTYISSARSKVEVTFDVDERLVEAMSGTSDDVVLVFEFHAAFQITLDSISIGRTASLGEEEGGALIELEDADIIAQAAITKGCEHWISPVALKWRGDVENHAQPATEQRRWSWSYRDLGTVEVVICVFNAIDETLQCLRSLTQSTGIPHTVSIIDDGSNANGAARIEEYIRDKPWMRLHRNAANVGYTRSADFGVRSAASDWVVLLNSDTIVSPGWLEGMLEVAASDPQISLVGPVSNAASYQSVPELHDASGQWATNELPAGMTVAEMAELVGRVALKAFPRVPLLNGFCTLIRRSVFVEIGGLDASAFPMGYGEENDMCLRARDQGHMLAVADHVYVHHIKSASFGKERRAELTKAGNLRLREKHPAVDFGRLGREFSEVEALVTLRQRVREALIGRLAAGHKS